MHAFALLLGSFMAHNWPKALLVSAQRIVTYFNAAHKPLACFREALGQQPGQQVGLQSSNGTRLTSVQLCGSSVLQNHGTFNTMLATPGGKEAVANSTVLQLLEDQHFFADLSILDEVLRPVCWVIMAVQRTDTTLADITRCATASCVCKKCSAQQLVHVQMLHVSIRTCDQPPEQHQRACVEAAHCCISCTGPLLH
jgi:hypothetical protein